MGKEIIGNLKSFNEEEIILSLDNQTEIKINRKEISLIKTFFDWDNL